MLAASSGKRNGVCKSAYLSGRHTHHDSPGGNIRRGQRKFQPDNKKDRHACWFQISLFSGTLPALFRWWLTFQVQLQALEYFISMLLAVCSVCGCNIHIITIKPRRLYAVHRCDIYFYLYDVARRLCLCVCVSWTHAVELCEKQLNRSRCRLGFLWFQGTIHVWWGSRLLWTLVNTWHNSQRSDFRLIFSQLYIWDCII